VIQLLLKLLQILAQQQHNMLDAQVKEQKVILLVEIMVALLLQQHTN
jgi:hypothetical protein